MPKLNEFPENLRCSNINGAMHKLLVGECLTGATKTDWNYSLRIVAFVGRPDGQNCVCAEVQQRQNLVWNV